MIILFFVPFAYCQKSKKIDIDIEGASPMLSIELETKRGAATPTSYQSLLSRKKATNSIIIEALLFLNKKSIDDVMDRKIGKYLIELDKNLFDGTGHLIKIQLYVDEFGNNRTTNSAFLALGNGIDPIDALSENINSGSIISKPHTGYMKDVSVYKWIKKENGTLLVYTIPRYLNNEFYKQANQMSILKIKNRKTNYSQRRSLIPNYFNRANYWYNKIEELEAATEGYANLSQLRSLMRKFEIKQNEFSKLINEFEELKQKKDSRNTLLNTVEILIELGSALSGGFDTSPEQNMTYNPTFIRNELTIINNSINDRKKEINKRSQELNDYDNGIKKIYNNLLD